MFLSGKHVLLISPEPWGENFVSKHHYAITLAEQGNTVYFLNPPSSFYEVQSIQYNNLHIINYPPFLKGLRYLPDALQRKAIRQRYEKLQQLTQCIFDIVWSFDNSVFYDFSALPESVLKISHIVDLNQSFQTAKATTTADICFCTTDYIRQKLRMYNANVFKIHHGYSQPDSSNQQKTALPGNNSVKAVYVGNLTLKYIDWKLLQTVIGQHHNIDFVFIGPEGNSNLTKSRQTKLVSGRVKSYSNAYFIGSVPSSKISAFLQGADILLITYQADLYTEQLASPHKFMCYFGSGRVTVATYTDEYKDKRTLLAMSERNEEYPALFTEIVNNLDEWNCQAKQEERKRFAINNAYGRQVVKIDQIIDEKIVESKDRNGEAQKLYNM